MAEFEVRTRRNGETAYYWRASRALVKRGYKPTVVRLCGSEADCRARAAVIQAEALEWLSGARQERRYDGSLSSLCDVYQTDPDSPYRDLRAITQEGYAKHLRLLMRNVGARRVDQLTGLDIRRWYRNLAEPGPDGPQRHGYAALHISILKSALNFGAMLGFPGCSELRDQCAGLRLKQAPARKTRLMFDQLVAFREAAHAAGRHSMALGLALQFNLAFRQRDVIGEWFVAPAEAAGIRHGALAWRDGLTWSMIDGQGIIRKTTSKTGAAAAHRVADYPDLMDELDAVPADRRVGPMVLNEDTGLPYKPEAYRAAFREIARAAGIPDDVWNMDARAGAVTEAYESGADIPGAMSLATHTQVSTSRRYNRDGVDQTSRVAKLRVERRGNKQTP